MLKKMTLYKIRKKIMSTYNMNNLTKDQLIDIISSQNKKIEKLVKIIKKSKNVKPTVQDHEDNIIQPPSEFRDKPVPAPRKNVKQMVQDYEDNIIQPPLEFRDKPVPLPRTKKPVPLPRSKIEQVKKALKGYTKSFEISIINNKDPLTQLQNTRKAVEYHIIGSLSNHDERDDDDVKHARRDWDENVAFGGKMKLKQRGCSKTTTKEFLSDSPRI